MILHLLLALTASWSAPPSAGAGGPQVPVPAVPDEAWISGIAVRPGIVQDAPGIPSEPGREQGWKAIDSTPEIQLIRNGVALPSVGVGTGIQPGDRLVIHQARVEVRLSWPDDGLVERVIGPVFGDLILLSEEMELDIQDHWRLRAAAGSVFVKVSHRMEIDYDEFVQAMNPGTVYLLDSTRRSLVVYEGEIRAVTSGDDRAITQEAGAWHRQEVTCSIDDRARVAVTQPTFAERWAAMQRTWLKAAPRGSLGVELMAAELINPVEAGAADGGGGLLLWFVTGLAPDVSFTSEAGFWASSHLGSHRALLTLGVETRRIPLLQPHPSGPAAWILGLQWYNELTRLSDVLVDWQVDPAWYAAHRDSAVRPDNLAWNTGPSLSLARERIVNRSLRVRAGGRVAWSGSVLEYDPETWTARTSDGNILHAWDHRHLTVGLQVGLGFAH